MRAQHGCAPRPKQTLKNKRKRNRIHRVSQAGQLLLVLRLLLLLRLVSLLRRQRQLLLRLLLLLLLLLWRQMLRQSFLLLPGAVRMLLSPHLLLVLVL